MLRKLFKKKIEAGITPRGSGRNLSELVDQSTLPMMTNRLFMHYFDKNTPVDIENPLWQNQGVFFWDAEENFEKKSLPPEFTAYEERFFIINEMPINLSVSCGKVVPWFGMPGNGDKFFFSKDDDQLDLESMGTQKFMEYVYPAVLTNENASILTDRNNYRILLHHESMRFDPSSDKFFFNGNEVTLGKSYELGGVKIIRIGTPNTN